MASKKYREHWYSGIQEGFQMLIPGSKIYHTMPAVRARTGYLFIMPFIIGFVFFMAKPLIESFIMSLSSVKLVPGEGYEKTYVAFQNYSYAFRDDPYYLKYLLDEIRRMAINAVATIVLSFVIAVILNQKFKGRTLCRVIFFLPVILASGVIPGVERQSSETYTMMQDISQSVGASSGVNLSAGLQNLLSVSGVGSGVFSVIFEMIDAIYDIVMASGIQIIVFLSGLQSISPSLYEAAEAEGCSGWETFWKITFPMVSPLLLVNTIYTIIDFFMKNDNTVMDRINTVMYSQFKFGEASAMSWIYFGVATLFIGISAFIIARTVKSYE